MSAFHIWTIGCQMNVADSRRLAESLERNGLVVKRARHGEEKLAEGDVLEIVTFVGGG